MGDQVKLAFKNIKEAWNGQAPKLKRIIVTAVIGLLAFAVALTLYLNLSANRWMVLYPGMTREESSEVFAMLQELTVPAQLNDNGLVMVRASQSDFAIGQLAMKQYPKTTMAYTTFDNASGLTSTDFEKQQALIFQTQDRLQDTIKLYDGVKNAVVNLNVAKGTNRVWETTNAKSTGNVSIFLNPGVSGLTKDQVSGIKFLVSSSVPNLSIADVKVIDGATSISLASNEDADMMGGMDFDRLNFEEQVEKRICDKALNVLTVAYKPEDIRVSSTVMIDYQKMTEESKQYKPSDASTTNTGVLQHQDTAQASANTATAAGVPGETTNTDVPTYVDGTAGTGQNSDNSSSSDYLVSYILQQIEKDRAELKSASIAVAINGTVDATVRDNIVDNVSKATNIAPENISVQSFIRAEEANTQVTPPVLDPATILIFGGAILLVLLLLIILLVAMGKHKKNKKEKVEEERMMAQAQAAEDSIVGAEHAEAFTIQKELEDRKRQLKENAKSGTTDEAITNEVRDFAKNNPEITANLLRAWMKEDID